MFKKLSLKWKLLSSFFLIAALLVVVGGVGWNTLKTVVFKYDHVATINLSNMNILAKMVHETQESHLIVARLLVTETSQEIEALEKEYHEAKAIYAEADKVYN
ncbi:MAG: MCP four helix bundle domain-containing protein, partial [Pseudobdellovibrionaceae bacterium]